MPTPQEEALALAQKALPLAVDMIGKRGGFLPYGVVLMKDGQTEMFGGDGSNSNEIMNLIKGAFKAKAREGNVRATALALDSMYTPEGGVKGDAIAIQICHAEDRYGVTYIWPYTKVDGKAELGTGFPQRSPNDIFV